MGFYNLIGVNVMGKQKITSGAVLRAAPGGSQVGALEMRGTQHEAEKKPQEAET